MKKFSNDVIIDQISKLHSSAIELKEKYNKQVDSIVIIEATKTFLSNYDHLQSLMPKEILDNSSIGRLISYFRWKPGQNYSDISNICSSGTLSLNNQYLEYKFQKFIDDFGIMSS
jgi:hypothetical protein